MTTPRSHYSAPNNATSSGLLSLPDNSLHFVLDGHEVDRDAFYGIGGSAQLRRVRMRSVIVSEIQRAHRLYVDGTTLAEVDTAYRTIKNVRWMLEHEDAANVQLPRDDIAKFWLVSAAADEYDRQQRSDEFLALLTRTGIAFAACPLVFGVSSVLAPATERPILTGWGVIIGAMVAFVVFVKGSTH
jgi:hypothetical protein